MTLCPVALAVGCRKCPIFAVCPLKGAIGDFRKEDDVPPKAETPKTGTARTSGKGKGGAKRGR